MSVKFLPTDRDRLRMVNSPSERKRGEAVHAGRSSNTPFDSREASTAPRTGASQITSRVEAHRGAAHVGQRCNRRRRPGDAQHLAPDLGELEGTLACAARIWSAGSRTEWATASSQWCVREGDGPRCEAGSKIAGIRLRALDGATAGAVLVGTHGRKAHAALAIRAAADARVCLAQDEADHSELAESGRYETGAEGTQATEKGALDPEADYELWFADGVRFELLPVTTYTYRERGRPLRIPTPGKNARVAVCGAMRWPDGPFVFMHGPKCVNTGLFVGMVQMLETRARRTGKRVILVIDNGSAHKSKRSSAELARVCDLIQVFWLPTYTSEQLNDIEALWKHLKEDYFCRMLVEDREEFRDATVALLSRMCRGRILRELLKPRHRLVGKNLTVPA